MATLFIAKKNETITDFNTIKNLLKTHNVDYTRWKASAVLSNDADQETILKAYAHELKPFMNENGYATADVINVHPQTPNLKEIREKFMKEHTHSENEIRFFVDGKGKFWFNLDNEQIICLTCERGDFISVPKNYKHWFDLAPDYFVKAIRIFSNTDGWTPVYTNSGIDAGYNP